MKELLKQYFELQKQIYSILGYKESWTIFPIEDYTNEIWFIYRNNVYIAKTIEDFENPMTYSSSETFGREAIFSNNEDTGILIDTNTDSNKFFAIFSNNNQIRPVKSITKEYD